MRSSASKRLEKSQISHISPGSASIDKRYSGRVLTRTPLRQYSEPEDLKPSTPRAGPFNFVGDVRDQSRGLGGKGKDARGDVPAQCHENNKKRSESSG